MGNRVAYPKEVKPLDPMPVPAKLNATGSKDYCPECSKKAVLMWMWEEERICHECARKVARQVILSEGTIGERRLEYV